jgi:hypothetical protein
LAIAGIATVTEIVYFLWHLHSLQQDAQYLDLSIRISGIWLFSLIAKALFHGELLSRQRTLKRTITENLRRIENDAHMFRLTTPVIRKQSNTSAEQEQKSQLISSVGSIRDGINNLFQMSIEAFSPTLHSLILFISDDEHLTIKEAYNASNLLTKQPIPHGQGILGLALKKKESDLL